MVKSREVSTALNSPRVGGEDRGREKRKAAKQGEDVQVDGEDEKDLMMGLVGGLEHTRQLADSLFERWCEGLRLRWPAV